MTARRERGGTSASLDALRPTFLCIGVPRAGTTWLHSVLSGHPEVYVPTQRKEIRFFDRHYHRGPDWYARFFSPPPDARGFAAVGEISPQYLYCEECPERIASDVPDAKLLVMLRHPVDRAYSNYGFVVQRRRYRGSFEEFLATRPNALEKGHYARYLRRYLDRFERGQILPLLFEDVVAGGDDPRPALGAFLGVRPDGFPVAPERVNASTVPRFASLSNLAVKTGRRLRRKHLERIVDLGGRLGMRRLLTSGTPIPRLDRGTRRRLSAMFAEDFAALESSLGLDLSAWKR